MKRRKPILISLTMLLVIAMLTGCVRITISKASTESGVITIITMFENTTPATTSAIEETAPVVTTAPETFTYPSATTIQESEPAVTTIPETTITAPTTTVKETEKSVSAVTSGDDYDEIILDESDDTVYLDEADDVVDLEGEENEVYNFYYPNFSPTVTTIIAFSSEVSATSVTEDSSSETTTSATEASSVTTEASSVETSAVTTSTVQSTKPYISVSDSEGRITLPIDPFG